ncbi:MAG: hypothetical protein PHC61_05385 [Chitinivibrionales bacterium]|nr:hypothetical protein [Chitinivibrionales bacterium]
MSAFEVISAISNLETIMKNHYLVCVKNIGYDASLELSKLYKTIPDPEVEGHAQVRIIDESGEDYVYPKDFFMELELPAEVEQALSRAA